MKKQFFIRMASVAAATAAVMSVGVPVFAAQNDKAASRETTVTETTAQGTASTEGAASLLSADEQKELESIYSRYDEIINDIYGKNEDASDKEVEAGLKRCYN